MPPVRTFRTALYLSLGLAVFGLGLAGGDLLPEIPYLTALALVSLAVAYYLEGRWQLSLRDANVAGLGLAGVLLLWGVFQFVRPATGLSDMLPWPASALPYLAAVLMLLIPAKMFRPKHSGDYWAMHGLALAAMAMACALAQDGVFALVFAAFAVAFVWSLTGFHLYREAGPLGAERPLAGGRWRALGPAALWAALTGVVAVPLFWATPRTGTQWELGLNSRGRVTGLGEGPVDLNTTGPVAVNQEKAFQVYAEDRAGNPVLDLPPDLKFRVVHLQQYDGGRWGRNQFTSLQTADRALSPPGAVRNPRDRLPDLGPGQLFLTFTLEPKLTRTPPLADPVAWVSGKYAPAVSYFERQGYRSWVHRHDGSLDGAIGLDGSPPRYVQTWVPPAKPGEAQPMRVVPAQTVYLTRLSGLNRLRKYTNELVGKLVRAGALPPEVLTDLDPDTQARAPRYHEPIARALERHLAESGEFAYTLDLDRRDKALDPTEDFVLNTKAGHCQRFATALVLMLRSQGIPSQMVLGYRGCESRGDGWYDVREDQAHAWVEVLVPSGPEGLVPVIEVASAFGEWQYPMAAGWQLGGALAVAVTPTPLRWQPMRWVTLDPTPAGGEADAEGAGVLGQARQRWEAVFKALLLAYNADSREQAADALGEWVWEGNGAAYLAGGGLLVIGLWLWRRRVRRTRAAWAGVPDPLRRLVAVLARAGYGWRVGQTAREWALGAGAGLRRGGRTAAVAGVPERVVSAYYAERFGGRAVGPDERRELDAAVGRLALALG